MKYLIFPEDYDPMVAGGEPSESCIRMEITWTKEDTIRARELQKQAVVSETKVIGRWHIEIEDNDDPQQILTEMAMQYDEEAIHQNTAFDYTI
jgi:hypothetical protein